MNGCTDRFLVLLFYYWLATTSARTRMNHLQCNHDGPQSGVGVRAIILLEFVALAAVSIAIAPIVLVSLCWYTYSCYNCLCHCCDDSFDVLLEGLVHEPVVPIELRIGQSQSKDRKKPTKDLLVNQSCLLRRDLFEPHCMVSVEETPVEGTHRTPPGQDVAIGIDLGEFEGKGLPVLAVALVASTKGALQTGRRYSGLENGPLVPAAPIVDVENGLPDGPNGGVDDGDVLDCFVGPGVGRWWRHRRRRHRCCGCGCGCGCGGGDNGC